MTPDNQLDTVLRHLDKDKDHFATGKDLIAQFRADTKLNISDKDFDMLLRKIVLDGHVEEKPSNDTNVDRLLPPTFFRITFQGRFFLSHGGYKSSSKRRIAQYAWTITKIIANAANAIIIIGIAGFAAWTSWSQSQQEDSNKQNIITITTRLEKYLSIRAFTDKQKREAFERQKGICPKCKVTFELNEMEADHITPWHLGGHSTSANCQMLCKHDNRIKSGI